eukprot:gene11641-24379_t
MRVEPTMERADAPPAKMDADLEFGLTKNVISLVETREQFFQRVLAPGELVVAEFNCAFPTKMLPIWKIILYTIQSCGLFLFVLLYRWIARWFYRHRCCTPSLIEFENGKLAVTSMGRIICWHQDIEQIKQKQAGCLVNCCICIIRYICCCVNSEICAAPVIYDIHLQTKIFSARKIRQVTELYWSKASCIWCCLKYECGVQVSFDEFTSIQPLGEDQYNTFVTLSSSGSFSSRVSQMVGGAVKSVESAFGVTSSENVLYIYSSTQDIIHNGDKMSALEELSELYAKVLSVLPPMPDVFFKNPDIQTGTFELSDQFKELTVVSDHGHVQIPRDWVRLLPGEEIIAVHGECFHMKVIHWILSIITAGLVYCICIRHKKRCRVALILTNKRFIALDICQRAGRIPLHLTNFDICLRSFFPESVSGGYISSESKKHLLAGISTSSGAIYVTFPSSKRKGLPFANAMQMTTSRRKTSVKLPTVSAVNFNAADYVFMPLMPEERPVNAIHGVPVWKGFGMKSYNSCLLRWICCHSKINYEPCSRLTMGHCFPYLPYVMCCCLLPLKFEGDIFTTESSIIAYNKTGNKGICGCLGSLASCCICVSPELASKLVCEKRDSVVVVWAVLDHMTGQELNIHSYGAENWFRRICNCCYVGRVLCPIGKSEFDIQIWINGKYSFKVGGVRGGNKNWLKDDLMLDGLAALNQLQVSIDRLKNPTLTNKNADSTDANGKIYTV